MQTLSKYQRVEGMQALESAIKEPTGKDPPDSTLVLQARKKWDGIKYLWEWKKKKKEHLAEKYAVGL